MKEISKNLHYRICVMGIFFIVPILILHPLFSNLETVFQFMVETFSIIIGLSIFTLVWNNEHNTKNNMTLMIGAGLLCAEIIEMIHTFLALGFNVFNLNEISAALAISVTGRILLSTFFIVSLILRDKTWDKYHILISFIIISVISVLTMIIIFGSFELNSDQKNLIKIISGYITIIINISSIYLINRSIDKEYEKIRIYIVYALGCFVISAYFFSLTFDVAGKINVLAHAFKALAFYLMYRAFIKYSYVDPFQRLKSDRMRLLEEYRFLFNSVNDGLVMHYILSDGSPSNFIMVNDSFCELSGYSRFELMEASPKTIQNKIPSSVSEELNSKGFIIFESDVISKDGRLIPVEVNSKVFKRDEKTCVISAIRDITQRIVMEKDKIEKERFIEQQTKMVLLGEMIGAIAHQWKQPLTSIAMLVQCLDEIDCEKQETTKNINLTVNKVMENIMFLSNTIDEFRNFIKPKADAPTFHVVKSIIQTVRIFGPQFKKDNITIDIHCLLQGNSSVEMNVDRSDNIIIHGAHIETSCQDCTNEKAMIAGSENEFKNAILNLLSNSRDAINEHNKRDGHIEIKISRIGDKIVVEISDNGGGIPAEIMDRIFNQFFTTKDEHGTGIGLYMVKNIIENNIKGSITCRNSGNGAIFTMTLPADALREPGSETA